MIMAQEKGSLSSSEYIEALQNNHRLSREEGIDAALNEHQLDAIIAPSGRPTWMTDLVNGDPGSHGSSSLAAIAGYPNITVPAGYVFGLPVGINFFGDAYQEPTLIKFAFAFEQATKIRQKPEFLSTAAIIEWNKE